MSLARDGTSLYGMSLTKGWWGTSLMRGGVARRDGWCSKGLAKDNVA